MTTTRKKPTAKPGRKSNLPTPTPKKEDEINPSHYELTIRTATGDVVRCETVDLIEAICPQDPHLGHALTYLTRAGRKKSSSYLRDLSKAAWWICRAVKFHGGGDLLQRLGGTNLD